MNDIEERLKNAILAMPRADLDAIINTDVQKMNEHDTITKQHRYTYILKPMAAVIILLCFVGGNWAYMNVIPYYHINIDVNPSVEMTLNKKAEVIGIKGINDDGIQLIDGVEKYRGGVDEGVELVLAKLEEGKYISEELKAVLLTVDGEDDTEANEILDKVDRKIADYGDKHSVNVRVIKKRVDIDNKSRKKLEHERVSPGKMELINEVSEVVPDIDKNEMKDMSIDQLIKLKKGASTEIESNEAIEKNAEVGEYKRDRKPPRPPHKNSSEDTTSTLPEN